MKKNLLPVILLSIIPTCLQTALITKNELSQNFQDATKSNIAFEKSFPYIARSITISVQQITLEILKDWVKKYQEKPSKELIKTIQNMLHDLIHSPKKLDDIFTSFKNKIKKLTKRDISLYEQAMNYSAQWVNKEIIQNLRVNDEVINFIDQYEAQQRRKASQKR